MPTFFTALRAAAFAAALGACDHEAATPGFYRQGAIRPGETFCSSPGSVVWSTQGWSVVPGGAAGMPIPRWMKLPPGFCVHYFGTVGDVRQLRFAPGGELFVASPTTETTGGRSSAGSGSIVFLADDDRDGLADAAVTFLPDLPSTQGLLFADGALYFQDGPALRRVPYARGDRRPAGAAQILATIPAPQDALHWPKAIDLAPDGTLYVTNGAAQDDACLSSNPTRGSVFAVAADGATTLVAKGFRNPIALRCERDHDVCVVVELARDYSADAGGREKLVPLRAGDDWGFPCCATHDQPYSDAIYEDTRATPDCSQVAAESDSFVIGHTPFGVDFEAGNWPPPWTGRAFVTLHGVAGTWTGARVVAIGLDPATGLPLAATELGAGGPSPDSLLEFATGWDDGARDHGRPAPIVFAPDGRMFLGDDNEGMIAWIAPIGLTQP